MKDNYIVFDGIRIRKDIVMMYSQGEDEVKLIVNSGRQYTEGYADNRVGAEQRIKELDFELRGISA